MNLYNKSKWFTIVELIIAIILSSIVLIWIIALITNILSEISRSENKAKIYSWINNIINKINIEKNTYWSSSILIDNEKSYDVLLLTNKEKKWWLLLWVVNINPESSWYMKLDTDSNYSKYDNKALWIKKIKEDELSMILTDSWKVFDINFYEDWLFNDLMPKTFYLSEYNSWKIIEANMTLFEKFNEWYIWEDINEVSTKWNLYNFTLDF